MAMIARRHMLLALALLLPLAARAGGVITGTVVAHGDGPAEPLVGATVLVQGTVRGTTTNSRGEFRIADLPPGTYTLAASLVGYEKTPKPGVTVKEGEETRVTIELVQTPVQLDQIVVTATKRQQSLSDVPVSLSVLDAKAILRRNAQTLDDALRYIPGVNMTGFQVNIRGSSGYNRGAGSRVLMLLDGIPLITGDTGELNFETIPVGQVDRIEVVKGASSALYGSNALGGVINVITRDIPDRPETDVRLYAGLYSDPSFGQWHWSDANRYYNGQSVSHSYRSGDLGVALFLSRQFDDGYRKNDYRRRYNMYAKVKEELSPTSALTIHFGLLEQYGGQYLYWRNLDSALLPPTLQADDNVRSERYFLGVTHTKVVSEGFLLTTRALWYHNFWGFETISGIGRSESQADDLRLASNATVILNDVHTLTTGIDVNVDLIGGDTFVKRSVGGFALYAQDEMSLSPALSVTAGLRYDFQSLGLTSPGGQVNPKLAARYSVADGTNLRASVGFGFRVPSVAEAFIQATVSNLATIPNKDLRPEKSVSYEIGVAQALGAWGTFDLAAFRSDYDNLIEPGLVVNGTAVQIQWRNVTQARVQGIETALNLGFFDGALTSSFGYTYVYPEDRTHNDILKYRPRHVLHAGFLGRVGPVSAGGDFRFVSRVDRIDDELVQVGIVQDGDERKDALVTDVRASVEFGLLGFPVTATASVNNLFQNNYVELIGNLMPPRTYVLALQLKP
jgi:outer membrane receptor for ferrienterochelin and colicins